MNSYNKTGNHVTTTISAWKGEHLRFSVFCSEVWVQAPQDILVDVFDVEAAEVSQRPALSQASANAIWFSKRLEIHKIFNRIDFIVRPLQTSDSSLPLLVDIDKILSDFHRSIEKWLVKQPGHIMRIAAGVVGLLPADSVDDANLKLVDLVKILKIDVGRFTEVQLQVNVPLPSTTDQNLKLNQLSTWGCVIFQNMLAHATISSGGQLSINGLPGIGQNNFCSCTLDINTDGERVEPLEKSHLSLLVNELREKALTILEKGIV